MTNPSSTSDRRRRVRIATRALVTTATAVAFVGLASVSASAAPGDTSADTVIANVNVNSTITLNLDQASFDLNGSPSTTVSQTGAVTGLVTTNNLTGYSVGVQANAATLVPAANGNTDSIPIADLLVADTGGAYTPLSSTAPVITSTKGTRSALAGDVFSDDYRVLIPDVDSDTYSVTLSYTATALA
jgi:hypothetical protein